MTKYDLFRRRIAPVAFALAIVLIARDACHKQEQNKATFVIDFGAAQPRVKAVDVELWMQGDQLAVFHRAALGTSTSTGIWKNPETPSPWWSPIDSRSASRSPATLHAWRSIG